MKTVMKTFLTAGVIALTTQANAIDITIANGSFELPTTTGTYDTLTAVTSIPGWDVTAGSVDHIGSYWQAADGVRSIDMSGNGAGTISQSIMIPTSGELTVNFWMAGNPDDDLKIKYLEVSLLGYGAAQSFQFDASNSTLTSMGWLEKTAVFVVGVAGSYTLQFESLNRNAYGAALDNVTASIPGNDDPTNVPDGGATLILLGTGLVAFTGMRRKLVA